MADIAAGDVVYTISEKGWGTYGYKNVVKLAFGDGALYYKTATKVPLTKAKMGCPNAIKSFRIMEGAVTTGYVWDFDMSVATTAPVLKGFYANNDGGADGPLIEIADTVQPAAQEVWATVEGW